MRSRQRPTEREREIKRVKCRDSQSNRKRNVVREKDKAPEKERHSERRRKRNKRLRNRQ